LRAQNQAPTPSTQAQPQANAPEQAATQGGYKQPVQDLTPLSDAEIDQMMKQQATEEAARKAAAQQAAQQSGATGQQPAPATGTQMEKAGDNKYVIRKDVEEVQLYATVVDKHNRMVSDLTKDNFTVYEDGQQQTITSFRREDIPVSLGILIDNSGSMRDKRPAVNQAALNLVRASNPQDEVFVVNYSDDSYLDQDFTAQIPLLKEALQKVEARGGTAMYDALIASADHLEKGGKRQKKVLLVVTDGEDNESSKTLEEAVQSVQGENGPTIYAIGILGDDRGKKRARRALERLALETGGIAFFPENLDEVDEISRQVAHDIRNQYTIGYKPSRPQSEGGFRSVRVEARQGKNKLEVRTRSGYYAKPAPQQAQNQQP
jgi:VWFA-related protein